MKILLLNKRPLTFEKAVKLISILRKNYPEISISEYLTSTETFRCNLQQNNNDIIIFATALHFREYFMGPYTFVNVVHNFPESFLKQKSVYSLLEYKEIWN